MTTNFLWIPGRLVTFNEIIDLRIQMFGNPSTPSHLRPNAWSKKKKQVESVIGKLAKEQRFSVPGPRYFNYFFCEENRRRDPLNFTAGAKKVIEDALQCHRDDDAVPLLNNDGWKDILGYSDFWIVRDGFSGVGLALSDSRRMNEEEASAFFEVLTAFRPNIEP